MSTNANVTTLPEKLPGALDLRHLNKRLRSGATRLDWSAVADAPAAALRMLRASLDIAADADALGLATVPEPLMDAIAAALTTGRADDTPHPHSAHTASARSVEAASASAGGKPVAAALWPPPATQPPLALPDVYEDEPATEEAPPADVAIQTEALADRSQDDEAAETPETTKDAAPVLSRVSHAELRSQLQQMVHADLLGPAGGEEEEIAGENVSDRYIVGMLAPRRVLVRREGQDDLAVSAGEATVEDDDPDLTATANTTLFPSSFGLTCIISGAAQSLRITARWGRYERIKSETFTHPKTGDPRTVWKRRPMSSVIEALPLCEGSIEALPLSQEQPSVYVRGEVRRLEGSWIVTLFLVNDQDELHKQRDRAWLFQPELALEAPDGAAIFCRHPIAQSYRYMDASDQREQRAMAMLYRKHAEFAVGHGVGVHATTAAGSTDTAVRVETRVIPQYEAPQTISPTPQDIPGLGELPLDMKTLAEMDARNLPAALAPLPDAYARWIAAQAARRDDPSSGLEAHRQAAEEALAACRSTLQRIREGIALLDQHPDAAAAFQFMNRAMWQQRIHGLAAEDRRHGEQRDLATYDAPQHHTWRLFQLAFILLNLPGLTDLHHPDRSAAPSATADLLWFPTGGGKTEAYLGLTAYTLAMRRLQGTVEGRSGETGVAVLMRYTLRLLTLQQFQRAAALICACERIRQEAAAHGDRRWGKTPFRLGLWVGQRTTPNWTDQSAEAIQQDHGHYKPASAFGGSGTPAQLTDCPWCGARIDPGRHIKVSTFKQGTGRTIIYCGDPLGECPFSERNAPSEGLPVVVVDEEIYRLLPALVIATVDKFAQLPWKGPVGMLFGQVNGYCPRHGYRSPDVTDSDSHPARNGLPAVKTQVCAPLRPPDLIIQDELHLISGPLGALVGLYESAVDRLASWDVQGQRVRPKVIASTATVRRASEQMRALFLRQVNVFPPHGLDVEDNFFSRQRPPDDEQAGRLYIGICAPGRRMKRVLIRVYAAYLLAAHTLFLQHGVAVDPWMTLVGYFNSIRELAGMRRLVEENVRTALEHGEDHGFARRHTPLLEELTSRRGSADIPVLLDRMEIAFEPLPPGETRGKRRRPADRPPPLDVLLATNMISVGVDVKRLGLMVVANQPKTTAEYIQATSRVGRAVPGLVCTVFNWARPRDLSHYETFERYHATFYAQVEALSVTPFAPRALDRGLSALLAALIRQRGVEFNANDRAGAISADHPYVREAIADLALRAELVTDDKRTSMLVQQELTARLEYWLSDAADRSGGRILGYQERSDGTTLGLLHAPDLRQWQLFTCLNSLRDVEPTITLVLDERPLGDEASRAFAPATAGSAATNSGDEEEEDDELEL